MGKKKQTKPKVNTKPKNGGQVQTLDDGGVIPKPPKPGDGN